MEKIGRYEIIGELGRGAMGVVYRALDPTIGRTVALKTTRVDVDHTERDELLRRLRNEAHAAGQMNHPNIVTIHDAGEWDGLFYIAMEYLEGETLQSLMAGAHPLSTAQIIEIAKQVAAGLEYAHSMNVVHRDIKPANIMIARRHLAKIMDFGISKSIGTLTRTGQVFGTPYYMSPEQVMGQPIDGRSDFFSFGVVLYEMATGARPFGGDTVATVIYKIINETPPPPCELQTAIDPRLSTLITRCLEKRPENRYQTGAELASALENLPLMHSAEQPRTVQSSNTSLPRTQALRIEQASAAAPKQSASTATVATDARVGSEPAVKPHTGASTGLPAHWFGTRRKRAWISSAVLVLLTLAALNTARRHRLLQQQLSGGASIVVKVPATLAKRAGHEGVEKREMRVRESEHAESHSRNVPEKESRATIERAVAVSFTSNPAGASIRLDGQSDPAWVTPYTIADVAPGIHRVVFYKEGYSPEFRDLKVGARDAAYGVDLIPK